MIPILSNTGNKKLPELENNETVLNTVSGLLSQIKGKTHDEGGENVNIENESLIFSSKIKLPKGIVAGILNKPIDKVDKMSPAELSKKFSTKVYDDILKDPNADTRDKNTANLMKQKAVATLNNIFQAQQDFKDSKGVKEGVLLKDQGLNADLNPIYSPNKLQTPQTAQVGGYMDTKFKNYFNNYLNNKNQVGKKAGGFDSSLNPEQLQNIINNIDQEFFNKQNSIGSYALSPAQIQKNIQDEHTKMRNRNILYNSNNLSNYDLSGLPQQGINTPTLPPTTFTNSEPITNFDATGKPIPRFLRTADPEMAQHPFITSGLNQIRVNTLPDNSLGSSSDMQAVKTFKDSTGWDNKKIRDTILDYQTKLYGYKGLDKDKNEIYDQSDLAKNRRMQGYGHVIDHAKGQLWKDMDFTPKYDANGELIDAIPKGVVDGMNDYMQYQPSIQSANPAYRYSTVPQLPTYNPANTITSILDKVNPETPIGVKPGETPGKQFPSYRSATQDALADRIKSEYMTMAGHSKMVPFLAHNEQIPAYLRPHIANDLAQEREQNLANKNSNDSDASNQMTQAFNSANAARGLDGMSKVSEMNQRTVNDDDNRNNASFSQAYNYNVNARNANMGDYVAKTQDVEAKYQHNVQQSKDAIDQLNLEKAHMTDTLHARNFQNKVFGREYLEVQKPDGTYTIEKNPDYDRIKSMTDSSRMFRTDDWEKVHQLAIQYGVPFAEAMELYRKQEYGESKLITANAKKEEADKRK